MPGLASPHGNQTVSLEEQGLGQILKIINLTFTEYILQFQALLNKVTLVHVIL